VAALTVVVVSEILSEMLGSVEKKAAEEARLKEHCYFEGKFIDVLIHTKYADSSPKS
jgi:hypothetical protein